MLSTLAISIASRSASDGLSRLGTAISTSVGARSLVVRQCQAVRARLAKQRKGDSTVALGKDVRAIFLVGRVLDPQVDIPMTVGAEVAQSAIEEVIAGYDRDRIVVGVVVTQASV